jgi:hypothetical protein
MVSASSSNGKTADFESANRGSSPRGAPRRESEGVQIARLNARIHNQREQIQHSLHVLSEVSSRANWLLDLIGVERVTPLARRLYIAIAAQAIDARGAIDSEAGVVGDESAGPQGCAPITPEPIRTTHQGKGMNMELREQIARACFFRGDEVDEKQWSHVQERHRALAYEQADAILSIPEIKEALQYRENGLLRTIAGGRLPGEL